MALFEEKRDTKEEKKCLELPVAVHLKTELKKVEEVHKEEDSNLASTRRESTEREPMRSARMKPH